MPVICCSSSLASSSAPDLRTHGLTLVHQPLQAGDARPSRARAAPGARCTSAIDTRAPSGSQRRRSTMRSTTTSRSLVACSTAAFAAHAALARCAPARLRPGASPCRPRPTASRRWPAGRPPSGGSARPWRSRRPAPGAWPRSRRASQQVSMMRDLVATLVELDDLALGLGRDASPATMVLGDLDQTCIRIAASRARRSQLPSASTSAARSSAMRPRKAPAATRSAWESEIDDSRASRNVRRISSSAMSPRISATDCSMPASRVRSWSVRRAISIWRSRASVAARSATAMLCWAARSAARWPRPRPRSCAAPLRPRCAHARGPARRRSSRRRGRRPASPSRPRRAPGPRRARPRRPRSAGGSRPGGCAG